MRRTMELNRELSHEWWVTVYRPARLMMKLPKISSFPTFISFSFNA